MEEEIRSILSRKDPQGYYVIVAEVSARDLVKEWEKDVRIEEVGDRLIIRTRSRRIAERLARRLASRNMLRFDL